MYVYPEFTSVLIFTRVDRQTKTNKIQTLHTPVQVVPFPLKPGSHAHEYEPTVLVHVALDEQGESVEHSSIS